MTNKAIAIIPARGGSVRVPRKNILPLNNIPAIGYPITSCLASNLFEQVLVSTEDEEISHIGQQFGAEIHKRPSELADNTANTHQVVDFILRSLTNENTCPEYFCIVYATAALLEPKHLIESFNLLIEKNLEAVLAVRRYHPHPYKALSVQNEKLTPEFTEHFFEKSQTFPEFYAPAGFFHWMRSDSFLQGGKVWNMKRKPYVLPADVAVDLDEPEDIALVEKLLVARQTLHGIHSYTTEASS